MKAFFFGDSNTYGYDPAGFMGGRYPRRERWTTILQDLLAVPAGDGDRTGPGGQEEQEGAGAGGADGCAASAWEPWEITSDGMPGREVPRSRYELDYLDAVLRGQMPLDLFGIMLGTNDVLGTVRPDAERTAREMDAVISMAEGVLAQGAAGARILLIAPPRIRLTDQSFLASYVSGNRSMAGLYQEEGEKLTRLYRELADRRRILFADASAWPLDFAHDGVHLSEKGHARFAAEMAEVLRAL